MADAQERRGQSFEQQLARMFTEAPSFGDDDRFAARVEARLDRAWTMRRWLIGLLGLVGGAVGISQLIGRSLGQQVSSALAESGMVLSRDVGEPLRLMDKVWSLAPKSAFLGGVEGLWLAAALGVAALAFAVTRAVEEL